ncbi:glycoside hydrolase family 127 protein [Cellulomonas sp. DKR-3]|uniref:Glycoside hydrolase family 127 protein n=1 Tax=Cellulomonas fulva TaxID=2835530 RepID=A0ABS5TW28_9CELL|nr:beta-L-arabinofuranosidase domain-containing protein [Cellulomonas fulva]MBT0993353.1 glycoside hydrolase family 127 protein [Cellulomonas fulva]
MPHETRRRTLRRLVAAGVIGPFLAAGSLAPADAAEPALSDPVLDLPFEQSVADAGPLAHPTELKGTLSQEYVEGVEPGTHALQLKGGTYLDLGTSSALQPQDLTLSFWVRPTSTWSGEQVFTWNKTTWNSDGWYVASESNASPLAVSIGPATSGNNQPYMVTVASQDRASFMPVGQWTHLAVTYDHTTKAVTIYRNGRAVDTTVRYPYGGSNGATGVLGTSAGAKTIGFNGPVYNGSFLNATLDEYRVYDEAATAGQVEALFVEHGDLQAVAQQDADGLTVPEQVTLGVVLPTKASGGSDVAWTSSDPAVLSETGVVHRPGADEPDAVVTLTASVSYLGGPAVTRTFTVTVPADTTESTLQDSGLDTLLLQDDYLENAAAKEHEYLLSLSSEKFLYEWYRNVGLTPTTDSGYGGWERADVTNFRGHAFGHYMSALSQSYGATTDATTKAGLLAEIEDAVAGLTLVQDTYATQHPASAGYVSAFPESALNAVDGTGTTTDKVLVPWYNLHKVLAGLLDVHEYVGGETGDAALDVAQQFGEYVYRRISALSNKSIMLRTEYGGMNEALYELYDLTDDPHIKVAAEAFDETALFDLLAGGNDVLSGKHANTTIPKLIGALKRYTVFTQDPEKMATLTPAEVADLESYRDAAENFWQIVVDDHTYATGANSQSEHFHDPDSLHEFATQQGETGDAQTAETCNEYNMLKLTRELFKLTKDVKYANFYENTFINTILASQNPETGMTTYFQPMAAGYDRIYSMPYTEFWCCTGTGMENFSKLGDSMYFTDRRSVYVTMFFSSRFDYAEQNLRLTQEANLPTDDTVTFRVAAIDGDEVAEGTTLRLRVPQWIDGDPTLTVNGETVTPQVRAGFVVLEDVAAGDEITYRMPMTVQAHATEDNATWVAFSYGPVLLSTSLGSSNLNASQTVGVGVRVARVDPSAQTAITVAEGTPEEWLADLEDNLVRVADSADGQVRFELRNTTDGEDLLFTPHYRRHGERYGLYLYVESPDGPQMQARILAAKQELRDDEIAVDGIDNFDANNAEAEKGLKTGGTGTSQVGVWNGRQYRDAYAGGWFSYDLEIDPSSPTGYLRVRYFGGDNGRSFDVYVNDVKLKTVTVSNAQGASSFYFDDTLLPASALEVGPGTRYKKDVNGNFVLDENGAKIPVVTVRFQSTGGLVGGVFGAYVLRTTDYGTDPELAALSFDTGDLAPAFSPTRSSYTLTVPPGTTSVRMSATPHTPSGLVYVGDVLIDDTVPRTVRLEEDGTTSLTLVAKAQDHSTAAPYVVTVVERAVGTDASLKALTVDGSAVPGFAPDVHEYAVQTATGTAVVEALATDPAASVAVAPRDSSGAYVVTVTAEDGTTTATYRVVVSKLAPVTRTASTTTVSVYRTVRYGATHTVKVKVVAKDGSAVSGKATVTVRKAGKAVQVRQVTLTKGVGSVRLSRLAVGQYSVQATYAGSSTVKASSGIATTQVVKAKATVTATLDRTTVKARTGTAKLAVTVRTPAGVTPTGSVKVQIVKGGKVLRTQGVKLSGDKATVTLKNLTVTGTYTVKVSYGGSTTLATATAKPLTLRVV